MNTARATFLRERPAAMTVQTERRLAAIMIADIVGYSRLIEADEADTLSAIRDLRQRVARI
jgi:class 3 adenylate cyclase